MVRFSTTNSWHLAFFGVMNTILWALYTSYLHGDKCLYLHLFPIYFCVDLSTSKIFYQPNKMSHFKEAIMFANEFNNTIGITLLPNIFKFQYLGSITLREHLDNITMTFKGANILFSCFRDWLFSEQMVT